MRNFGHLLAFVLALSTSTQAVAYDPADYTTITLPNGQPFTYLSANPPTSTNYDTATQTVTLSFADGASFVSAPTYSSASSGGSAHPETFDNFGGPASGTAPTGSGASTVPEPAVASLFAFGALGLIFRSRRKRLMATKA
jgi:hypothetical protein